MQNQQTREKIIPLARKHPLDQLRATLRQINDIQQREVMIEYLMLKNVNDSPSDAQQLTRWLEGLRVHVNLIPWNPIDEAPHLTGTDRASITAFADLLRAADLKTTVRYSLGHDIAAACGQLVRKENRQRAMEADSSIGKNMTPETHTHDAVANSGYPSVCDTL